MDIQDFLAFVKSEFVGKKGWSVTFSEPSYDGYGYECAATIKTPGYQHDVYCTVDDDKSSDLSGQSVAFERGKPTDKCSDLPSGKLDGLTLARIVSAIAALETASKPSKPPVTKTRTVEKRIEVEKERLVFYENKKRRRNAAPKKKPDAVKTDMTEIPEGSQLIFWPFDDKAFHDAHCGSSALITAIV